MLNDVISQFAKWTYDGNGDGVDRVASTLNTYANCAHGIPVSSNAGLLPRTYAYDITGNNALQLLQRLRSGYRAVRAIGSHRPRWRGQHVWIRKW